MLDNVIVGDIMEEKTVLPSEERPVDSGCGAALEIPFLSAIMKKLWACMLQVGDHDNFGLGSVSEENAYVTI